LWAGSLISSLMGENLLAGKSPTSRAGDLIRVKEMVTFASARREGGV
jgi:hypothetical protein